ncbi:MAG: ABC transporter ATP-binding protein [Alphaproteobacteria bacterium]|nr:ABC transporter ATP-binding protein [Alphaproteobacteria bacterium]
MLEVRGLHAGYGRVPVLRGVDLSVASGEIVLVIGPNGAGKSTLLRSIAGFIRLSAGDVRLRGESILGSAPEALVGRGLRLVLDGHRVFPELTVADNIRLGERDRREASRLTEEVLAVFPVLRQKYRARARDLSGGQQQMLALAQAFVAQPAVLMCDEPSLGIAQALIPPILDFLRGWARQGTAVLIVEQQIAIALAMADRAVVLERGQCVLAGTADELRRDRRVQDIYLGLGDESVSVPNQG